MSDNFYNNKRAQAESEGSREFKCISRHAKCCFQGLEVMSVVQINQENKITQLPNAPGFLKGVINLNGRNIPVMNMKKGFNFKTGAFSSGFIVVVNIEGTLMGFYLSTLNEIDNDY